MSNKLVLVICVAIICAYGTSALAVWELYDDFSSGVIDPQRWSIDESSANISVENEQAKFVHQSGHPNDSGYLLFNQDPANILGIKVDVFIESCFGDVRARIAAHSGKVGENNVWSGLQLQPSQQKIYSYAGLEGPPPDYISVQDLHYAHFELPITVTQVPYNINIMFSNDKITYEVSGLGKITYKHENPIAPTDSNFKAMGTRSTNGDGPCTVFFDNVWVLRP